MAEKGPAEMPFLDHLEELRWRLIWSLLALSIGVAIGFLLVVRYDLLTALQAPIAPYLKGAKLVYTHPGHPFSIALTTAFIVGTILALPVITYQVWAFLSPALYRHEKRVVIPLLIGAAALFAGGAAMAYLLVLPLTLRFLLSFQAGSLAPMITAGEYFGFATTMALALGALFELPILIVGLTALGFVRPWMLTRWRKHALVLCWVVAAVISPGDFIGTTLLMAAPLYVLYEVSIWLSGIVYRRRVRREAAIADGGYGAPA
ncbi:MAG: twin-arginine translocase subunit TatC [Gemmatimonadaceae bacterium]